MGRVLAAKGLLAALLAFAAIQAGAGRGILQTSNQCVSLASNAASGPCQDFVALQGDFPSNPTDAQLQSYMDSHQKPDASCCAVAGELVTKNCQCDPSVQQLSSLYNLTPATLITFARAAKYSCGSKYIADGVDPYCNKTG